MTHRGQRPAVRLALQLPGQERSRPADLHRPGTCPVGMTVIARHPGRRRRALVVDPQARRQGRRGPRLHEQDAGSGSRRTRSPRGRSRLSSPASAPSSAAATTRTCTRRVIGMQTDDYKAWYADKVEQLKGAKTEVAAEHEDAGGRAEQRASNRGEGGGANWEPRPNLTSRPACRGARAPPDHRPPRRARRRAGPRGSRRPITRRSGSSTSPRSLVFFVLGGVEALLMRLQLARAGEHAADAGALQPDPHDARDDHGLPGHRPGAGGLRELPRCR